MRVLQLGPYPPPHGGVQTNLVAVRDTVRKHGGWAGVINLTRHRGTAKDDVYYPRNAFETLSLLLKLRYDIVHLHIGGHLSARLLALSAVCCAMPRKRSVLTFHSGGYPSSPDGRRAHARSLRGFIMRRFDRIIVVNAEISAMFKRFGVPQSRIHLIPPHAEPQLDDKPLPGELGEFFARHNPVLLTVGLLEPEYDLQLQIEVLGKIRELHPAAGLVIVGSGSLEPDLRRHIQSKDYSGHIVLYGDMAHDSTMRVMAASDVLLRTTRYDGDSVAVREALALGTPVVATDNAMRPRGVRTVPVGDIGSLVFSIEDALANSDRAPAAVEFPANENLENVYRLYSNLLNHPYPVMSELRQSAD
jgi:glycogen(starch) synthase